MRFKLNNIKFDDTRECHQNCLELYLIDILRGFDFCSQRDFFAI